MHLLNFSAYSLQFIIIVADTRGIYNVSIHRHVITIVHILYCDRLEFRSSSQFNNNSLAHHGLSSQ